MNSLQLVPSRRGAGSSPAARRTFFTVVAATLIPSFWHSPLDVLGHTFSFNEVFDLKGYLEGFKSGMWARLPGIHKSGEPLELMADAIVNIENLMRMERESD